MFDDKYMPGPPPEERDPHGPHGPHDHHHHWGPHGPDGPLVPIHVWPDVYHPVPYGKEWKGNENLSLDGEHWCPPRDHGRHGCHEHHHHHDHCHLPCDFTDVMGDYLDTAVKLLNATTYQERCDCVNELQRVKVKVQDLLKEFERQLDTNDKDLGRLKQKLTYFFGKVQAIQKDLQENMLRQDEFIAEFDKMAAAFEELEEAYKQYQDTNTTYTLERTGLNITLTGSDGTTNTIPLDEAVTYSLSYANDTLTLTGSDGSTASVTITQVPEATSADIQSIFN